MDRIYTIHYEEQKRSYSVWFNGVMIASGLDMAEAALMIEAFLRNNEED